MKIPICRKCKKETCQYYGEKGGYSVQCESCNARQSIKRRIAAGKRRNKLKEESRDRQIWMEGADAGAKTALEAIFGVLNKLASDLGVKVTLPVEDKPKE